jgi:hypothetical protein
MTTTPISTASGKLADKKPKRAAFCRAFALSSADRLSENAAAKELHRLNEKMDLLDVPFDVNEAGIESLMLELAPSTRAPGRGLLLLAARLAELTLLCAGHYADCGAFSAAGDLLLNPRKIVVRFCDGRRSAVKNRHGRMSDQFRLADENRTEVLQRLGRTAVCEQKRPPVFLAIYEILSSSVWTSPGYLSALDKKARQVTDTIGYLAAGGISSPEAVWRYHRSLSEKERRDFESNLCRFSPASFFRLGDDFRSLYSGMQLRSPVFRVNPLTSQVMI